MEPTVVKVQVEPDTEVHNLLVEAYRLDPEATVHVVSEPHGDALATSVYRCAGRVHPTGFPHSPRAWLAEILGPQEGFLFALSDRPSIDLVLIATVGGRRRRYEGSCFFHDEVEATILMLRPAPTRRHRTR